VTSSAPTPQTRPLGAAEALSARAELQRLSATAFRRTEARTQAVALASRAHAADPGLPDPVALLVALQELSGDARTEASRAVAAARPDDWRGPELLAEALAGGKDSPERIAALEKAVELGATEPAPLAALAWHRLKHGEPKKAVALAERAALLAPGNPGVLDTLAVGLAAAGRCADAALVNRRSVEVVPDGAPAAAVEQLRNRADAIAQECKARVAAQAAPAAPPPAVLSEIPAQPRKLKCKTPGPLVTVGKGVTEETVVRVFYEVTAAGRMAGLKGSNPADPAAAMKAIRLFLDGCRFELPPGAKPPVRVEEVFTFGGQAGK
jgi:Flp pilus assembly protein TadD